MNFVNKINTYLLERFPASWNTRFVWMMLIGLATHLLFFAIGYGALNYDVLKESYISNFFFKRGFFTFYIIICLVSLIYFGLKYFAHNPFKNFYPISKSYFWKIFGQLFLMFLTFFTVFISFEMGLQLKAKKIVPANIIAKEAFAVNMAKPFLFNKIEEYHFAKRVYPTPFPCEEISSFEIGYDTANKISIRHNIDFKKPYLNFYGTAYQYGKLGTKQIDECNTKQTLDTIYDLSKIYGIDEYSLYNYGKETFLGDSSNNIIKLTHKWYQNKDSVSIAKTIEGLKTICKKYNISEELQPNKMSNAILKQNLNTQQLISTGFYNYKNGNSNNSYDGAASVTTDVVSADNNNNRIKKQIDYNYSVDMGSFSTITENVESINDSLGTKQLFKEKIWLLIFLAFGFALFFVLVKYIPLKSLIIGIVVAAILLAFIGLIVVVNKINNDNDVLWLAVFYCSLIITIGLVGIYSKNIKKVLAANWMVSLYTAALCLLPFCIVLFREITAKDIYRKCEQYISKQYLFEFAPWHFILVELVAVFFIFIWMRKIHAKEE